MQGKSGHFQNRGTAPTLRVKEPGTRGPDGLKIQSK